MPNYFTQNPTVRILGGGYNSPISHLEQGCKVAQNFSDFQNEKKKYFHTFNISEIWFVEWLKTVESKYVSISTLYLPEKNILLVEMHGLKINDFAPM